MSILFRQFFKTVLFSGFWKVTVATSNFLIEVHNDGFAPEIKDLMLKETIALVRDYIYETRKEKVKQTKKYMWNCDMNYFSIETLAKTVCSLKILPQKSNRNFVMEELWQLENHALVNMLLFSSHFTEVH